MGLKSSDKIEVNCPICNAKRWISVAAYNKQGGSIRTTPYTGICRPCNNASRGAHTKETKDKISASLEGRKQSEEVIEARSEHWKNHPELWKNNIITKGDKLSDQHKEKIRNSISQWHGEESK